MVSSFVSQYWFRFHWVSYNKRVCVAIRPSREILICLYVKIPLSALPVECKVKNKPIQFYAGVASGNSMNMRQVVIHRTSGTKSDLRKIYYLTCYSLRLAQISDSLIFLFLHWLPSKIREPNEDRCLCFLRREEKRDRERTHVNWLAKILSPRADLPHSGIWVRRYIFTLEFLQPLQCLRVFLVLY